MAEGFQRGEAVSFSVFVTDAAGAPINTTGGVISVLVSWRRRLVYTLIVGNGLTLLSNTPASGQPHAIATLTGVQTLAMPSGRIPKGQTMFIASPGAVPHLQEEVFLDDVALAGLELRLELAGIPGPPGADGADGVGIPVGGGSGQVLAKATGADFDAEWADQTGGVGSLPDGGTTGQVLAKQSATDGDADWEDALSGSVSPQTLLLATGSIQPRSLGDRFADVVNISDYGSIFDGAVHPLSERYASLAAAQVDYPFATALTQQIDYCAAKAAYNAALGGDLEILTAYVITGGDGNAEGTTVPVNETYAVNELAGKTLFRKFTSNGFVTSAPIISNTANEITCAAMPFGQITSANEYAIGFGENGSNATLNRPVRWPHGTGNFGADTLTIRNCASSFVFGAGKRATIVKGSSIIFQTDGFWYSTIQGISFECTAPGVCAVDIDGNVPGHAYATRGVQSVTLQDVLIHGAESSYALTMCRQGGAGAQGSECLFLNVHLSSATFALYYQSGFNALANTFMGGNFQAYSTHAIYVVGGTFAVINSGFQSTRGYLQIENEGYDIRCGASGAYEGCIIYGCRTESMAFLYNEGAVLCDVRAVRQRTAMAGWFAETTYGPNANLYKAIHFGGRVFATESDGTSGATIPDFASVDTGGTVVDNTITWTEIPYYSLRSLYGTCDLRNVEMENGNVGVTPPTTGVRTVTSDTTLNVNEEGIFVNATAGDITITQPPTVGNTWTGRQFWVKKVDSSQNKVTILLNAGDEFGGQVVIPGGAKRKKTFVLANVPGDTVRWVTLDEVKYQVVQAVAVSRTLLHFESGDTFSNEGATGLVIYSLPVIPTGTFLKFRFVVADADGIRVQSLDGSIRVAGNVTPTLHRIEGTTIGDVIEVFNINATEWVTAVLAGAAVDWTLS